MTTAPKTYDRALRVFLRWTLSSLARPRRAALGFACLVCCLALALVPSDAVSQSTEGGLVSREYPLKALFLFNFGGYIEWPPGVFPSPQSPFVIGVLGAAPLDQTLDQIALTKKINGRKIVVQQFNSVADIKPCQILFIARTVPLAQQRQAIESQVGGHVFIVGEIDGFANIGGCANFFVQANKIRFEINLAAAKQQQLKVSSKLLAMAKIVQSPPADSARR